MGRDIFLIMPKSRASIRANARKSRVGFAAQPLSSCWSPVHGHFQARHLSAIGLIIAILFFSKREDSKTIAKLAAPMGVFNINEPIIFGMPIVLNPLYFFHEMNKIKMACFEIIANVGSARSYFIEAIDLAGALVLDGLAQDEAVHAAVDEVLQLAYEHVAVLAETAEVML